MGFTATIDVPDIDAALAFYGGVFGFSEVARPISAYAIVEADGQRLGLMQKPAGSLATPAPDTHRSYERHWTPIHLDSHVESFDAGRDAILRLGGAIEELHQVPGRRVIAFCSDPFGHGFCLLGPIHPA